MKKKKSVFKKILIGVLLVLSILIVLETMRDPAARKKLSGKYYFYYGMGYANSIFEGDTDDGVYGIYPKIIGYDYNSDFIIAAQQPDSQKYVSMISINLRMSTLKFYDNTTADRIESERMADSIIKRDPYFIKILSRSLNYWIISHKDKQVYGPYSKDEYLQKRIALAVPDNLQLDVE